MKKSIMAAAFAVTTTFAALSFAPASFADDKNLTPADAEKEIMRGCIENPDNTEAQCVCVLDGIKEGLPKKDYDLMINIFTFALNGDLGAMWDYAVKNDITLFELKRFSETIEKVTDELEDECGDPDINLDLNI